MIKYKVTRENNTRENEQQESIKENIRMFGCIYINLELRGLYELSLIKI